MGETEPQSAPEPGDSSSGESGGPQETVAVPRADEVPSSASTHERITTFFRDGAGVGRCDREFETHGARVFLIGTEAYKIKRPVDLGYLDFSTLERRRLVCHRELERNRAFAPDFYRRVVPVTLAADNRLQIAGPGEAVEWALVMARFDQWPLASDLADRGEFDIPLARQTGRMIAELHERCAPVFDCNAPVRLEHLVQTTADALCSALALADANDLIAAFRILATERLLSARDIFQERADRGEVRLCHGDLHLRNVVVGPAGPIPFDAIEFDDTLATIDVLYDLAFPLMDLWHRNCRPEANALLGAYLAASGLAPHVAAMRHVPVLMALRAAIRAMVTAHEARGLGTLEHARRARLGSRARGFVETAIELLQPRPVRLVAIGGLSGTGKSTIGARLAAHLGTPPGALHLRSDVIRKTLCGVTETDRLGPEGYTEALSARVYEELQARALLALENGVSVVADAVFARPEARAAIEAVAHRASVPFTGLWLDAPIDVRMARVEARVGDASDADVRVVASQTVDSLGPMTWTILDATMTPADVVDRARAGLAGMRGWHGNADAGAPRDRDPPDTRTLTSG